MRKNGSRLISVKQYRLTDLFVFALILAAAELLAFLATKWFPSEATYTFSLMVPIVLTIMMRWGWPGIIHAVAGGLLVCIIKSDASGAQYCAYTIGNAFIALMLIPLHFIGKDKIKAKWWASALYAIGGWLCVYLGRSAAWAVAYSVSPVAGTAVWSGFYVYSVGDIFSLFMSFAVVLILRRFDGMFEDQKSYLKRLDRERKERVRRDEFGDEQIEIDEETLSILNRDNDLYD